MRPPLRLIPVLCSLLSLLVLPAPLAAQGTIRPDRAYVGTSLAVGTSTVGSDPVRLVGLPSKASETECLWIDASGDVARGTCPVGTVTSVGLSLPSIFSVSGSPVTSSGTLTATLANQTAYSVFARAASTGAPSFQALADAHIPDNLSLGTVSGTPTFSGAVTFSGTITPSSTITGSLRPTSTDTYDLGSPALFWSNGYVSQLNAVVFAEQTASLVGGWLIVPKDQGSTVSAISSGSTSVDFGKAMTVGHFVVIRSVTTAGAYATEYLQVGSLVTGTTYNVTRDLAGAHGTDPAWAAGTAYLVLGTTGDGRIELNAYDTPRISVLTQGATYNAQTELVRLGALDGMPGVPAGRVGLFIGDATDYLWYDPTNGLTIAGDGDGLTNIDGGNIQTGTVTAGKLEANLVISTNIQTSPTCGTSGTCVRLNSSGLTAYSGSTPQFAVDAATGTATAGSGTVTLDADGIHIPLYQGEDDIWDPYGEDLAYRFSSPVWGNSTTLDAGLAGSEELTLGSPNTYVAQVNVGVNGPSVVSSTTLTYTAGLHAAMDNGLFAPDAGVLARATYTGTTYEAILTLSALDNVSGGTSEIRMVTESVLPYPSSGAVQLGSASYRWGGFYATSADLSGDLAVGGNVASHLIPYSTNTYNLGSSTNRWNEIWMDRTHETTTAHLPVVISGGGELLAKSNGLNTTTTCSGGQAVKSINTQYGIVISVTCGAL